ncbi:MAG TPA: type II toxin-antitoxin system HicB family antitoxin [Anaerolineales bacterium]|jgi:predicted RNase H-like HicB family nuclease|nr:type II toxin-antitoxin system HicB family antitoxin [Anaerolineales bacterium]
MTLFSFTGIVVQEDQGYSSLCPELDVASSGNTPEEARAMLLEAAALHLEGAIEDGMPYLRPVPADADPRNTEANNVVQVFSFKVDVAVHAYA